MLNKRRDFFRNNYRGSINSRAQDVIQLLKQSKSPLRLGIWGMAGVGKSAIAKAIYDQIGPYFEDTCFLEYVQGASDKNSTLVSLQEKLLFEIDTETKIDVSTIESGDVILKERLQQKKVLFILGVDKLEHLNALCGSREWFGEGSKIIIMTSDRQLLKEHVVDHIYRVKELDESESLVLFNWSAFRQATSYEGFAELSRQIVACCGGLPLALKSLGEYLLGREVLEWKGVLSSLERFSFPNQYILHALRRSFDDLSDEEKEIFLDIAFFSNGMDKNSVHQKLNSSTQSTTLQISLLEDKSFVTIDDKNKIQMSVVLQAMARDIIKTESRNNSDQVCECVRACVR